MNGEITFFTGDETLIGDIEELWIRLNQIHFQNSPDFKHRYKDFTFQKRKQSLLSCASKGKLSITVAYDGSEKVGYCVSSIADNIGDIDSIYVKPGYRRRNIGSALVEKSLDWINSHQPTTVTIKVAIGNEEALAFYSNFGFRPIFTELQIATEPSP
ncbi:MAG: GNAT family N-acetyltransferase [Deltaproteobacteria bacterium]|nr:GNAT family N-acetyltransferase [Deltaproteobacteria bacterium]